MNVSRLQQAIDRVVTIKARLCGLEFQAEPCLGQYFMVGSTPHRRLKLYRACAPTPEAVTDTAIEMLARIHERFGPGRVWTIGNDGASKRIAIMQDDGNIRTDGTGKIMLRMYYVHEHDTLGSDEDPESKWPWMEPSTFVSAQDSALPAPHPALGAVVKYKGQSPGTMRVEGSEDGKTWLPVTESPATCPLCGKPCDRVEVGGVTLNGCPCVGTNDRAIAVDYSKIRKDPGSGPFDYGTPDYAPIMKSRFDLTNVTKPMPHGSIQDVEAAINELARKMHSVPSDLYAERDRLMRSVPADPEHDRLVRAQFDQRGVPDRLLTGHLKHGPGGRGGAGPCDADCAKCHAEQANKNRTPAGRLQAVLDLALEGKITQEQARQLLNAPDLEITRPIAPPDHVTAEAAPPPNLESWRGRLGQQLWLKSQSEDTGASAEFRYSSTWSHTPVDPLDVEYDGNTLRVLLTCDDIQRRGECIGTEFKPTPLQRSAISAHWSAELKRKVAASKDRERQRVVVDLQEIE